MTINIINTPLPPPRPHTTTTTTTITIDNHTITQSNHHNHTQSSTTDHVPTTTTNQHRHGRREVLPLYYGMESQRQREDLANLWHEPHDRSHTATDEDRELFNKLQRLEHTRRGSEGWRKLSVDIGMLRQVRRDAKDRWRMILSYLGFEKEADTLLSVTGSSSLNNMKNVTRAKEILQLLADDTSIFKDISGPPERYIFVLDRLITLDIGEAFLARAKHLYPKDDDDEDEDDDDRDDNEEKEREEIGKKEQESGGMNPPFARSRRPSLIFISRTAPDMAIDELGTQSSSEEPPAGTNSGAE
ncbi:melanoregulin-like isoform X1 [Lethenteron reissneri]|uniref:melanoregulin-like isoform X1 n=1 Tax=Lethenteron reissneri TaxID=7753 RepID=UPI002AB669FF|nr:melanoregulin-like isoform X1 [Lethenteron reissneri]